MNWGCAGIGLLMWIFALFCNIASDEFNILPANVYTGIFVLIGLGYFMLSVIRQNDN